MRRPWEPKLEGMHSLIHTIWKHGQNRTEAEEQETRGGSKNTKKTQSCAKIGGSISLSALLMGVALIRCFWFFCLCPAVFLSVCVCVSFVLLRYVTCFFFVM